MSKRMMWMGPRGYERWVPAPQTGMDMSAAGWSSKSSYLTGGAGVRRSFATHKEYQPGWNANARDALRPITDMYSGMYGTGLIYFVDPMAADKNVLPAQWAWPALAAIDGPVLYGTTRPSVVPTAYNTLDYPATSAQYTPQSVRSSIYIPIPPEHTAWVGWHGAANGAGGLSVSPVSLTNITLDAKLPAAIAVNDPTRVNTAFSGDTYRGIELSFGGGSATQVTIAGVMVQILPASSTPQPGGFISGQGHSGCQFEEAPKVQAYSAAVGVDGLVTMSAKLTEIGDFR